MPQDHEHHHNHGNPEDLDAYLQRLEDPAREEWQKTEEVLRELKLRGDENAAEIGAGSGYISLRLARVAAQVFAVEVEPRLLQVLRDRIQNSLVRNVTPVLALPGDPLLPLGALDLALIVNTYHHFPDGPAYLRRLARSLRPGGRIVNIDFHPQELPVGPPPEHKLSRDEFLADARAAGLRLEREAGCLPYQYFLVLRPD